MLGISGLIFPLGFLFAHRLQKDPNAMIKDRKFHLAYFGYSSTVLLAYTLAEMKRHSLEKDLTLRYLSHASNDHLRVLAGEKVQNSGTFYSREQSKFSPQLHSP